MSYFLEDEGCLISYARIFFCQNEYAQAHAEYALVFEFLRFVHMKLKAYTIASFVRDLLGGDREDNGG